MLHRFASSFIGFALLVGCTSSTPGARPHDMSAAAHEQQAAAHEQEAEQHEAQYDASATGPQTRCQPQFKGQGSGAPGQVCWTSVSNPTKEHLAVAEQHHKQAADHRAASEALRRAEAQACVGISDEDRDMSPFDHVEDIATVEPLKEPTGGPKAQRQRTAGAIVTFRAVPGMTPEWLQRLVDCHLARNASLGHNVPEMPNCPLVPNGIQARVTSTGSGFAVAIRSDDDKTAQEILARAQRLRPQPVSSAAP